MFDWHTTARAWRAQRHYPYVNGHAPTHHVWIGRPEHPNPYPPALTAAERQSATECAERAGERAGSAAGSWVVDGNTSAETARAILAALDDGTFETPAPLSGEWADGLTPEEVIGRALDDAGIRGIGSPAVDDWSALLDAFEEGYHRGYEGQAAHDARAILPDITYTVAIRFDLTVPAPDESAARERALEAARALGIAEPDIDYVERFHD